MTALEKRAIKWFADHLAGVLAADGERRFPTLVEDLNTLRTMLTEPRLPSLPLTECMVEAMWQASAAHGFNHRQVAESVVAAMRAELAKPKTKMVHRVDWWAKDVSFQSEDFDDAEGALRLVRNRLKEGFFVRLVNVEVYTFDMPAETP